MLYFRKKITHFCDYFFPYFIKSQKNNRYCQSIDILFKKLKNYSPEPCFELTGMIAFYTITLKTIK